MYDQKQTNKLDGVWGVWSTSTVNVILLRKETNEKYYFPSGNWHVKNFLHNNHKHFKPKYLFFFWVDET